MNGQFIVLKKKMTPLIEKYIDLGKIEQIAIEKQFDKITYDEFIRFLDYNLEQDDRLGFDEEDHEASILEYVSEYIDEFQLEIKKGFSLPWTKAYVYTKLYEENQNPPSIAYYASLQINLEQAIVDLKLYCDLIKEDDLFFKHFVYKIQVDAPNVTPSPEDQAKSYSKIYKQQIENGKTDVFAHKYADLMARDEYSDLGCYSEAMEYEKAINEGHTHEYADWFAFNISEYIANYCSSYEESIGDELVELEKVQLKKSYKSRSNNR